MSNIKTADAKLISLSNAAMKRKAVFDKWNDTLATKLQNLKDKIAEARNTADGVTIHYFLCLSNLIQIKIRLILCKLSLSYRLLDTMLDTRYYASLGFAKFLINKILK